MKKHINHRSTYLSVIIPVYNEQSRAENLQHIITYLNNQKHQSEIIVINDGSTDSTLIKLKKYQKQITIISYDKNMGKGYAVKKGMLTAKGKYRLFMDIDLSTSLLELPKFILESKKGSQVIIGSRKTKGANIIKHQPIIRENMGKLFTLLSQVLLQTNVSDFTCGFKMFSDSASKKIFSQITINRWGFDSEILFLAHKFNYPIIEIPVSWKDNSMSKVRFPQDAINSFLELLKIRMNSLKGVYN